MSHSEEKESNKKGRKGDEEKAKSLPTPDANELKQGNVVESRGRTCNERPGLTWRPWMGKSIARQARIGDPLLLAMLQVTRAAL